RGMRSHLGCRTLSPMACTQAADQSTMTQHAVDPGMPYAHVEARRARILGKLGRAIEPVGAGGVPLAPERVEYLVREAEELYWNELAWEELTDEERVAGGHLTELVFPGLLVFIDALLQHRPADYEDAG